MKVYVVMKNDYPEHVFARKEDADNFCKERKKQNKPDRTLGPFIYWKVYKFKVIK